MVNLDTGLLFFGDSLKSIFKEGDYGNCNSIMVSGELPIWNSFQRFPNRVTIYSYFKHGT